jgi:hypothetical protein
MEKGLENFRRMENEVIVDQRIFQSWYMSFSPTCYQEWYVVYPWFFQHITIAKWSNGLIFKIQVLIKAILQFICTNNTKS